MRIALFHNLPSGGGKRAVHEWMRRLVPRHRVDVFTLSTADHQFCDLRPHVHAHHEYQFEPRRLFRSPLGRLNQLQRWLDLRRLESIGRSIAAHIDRGGYDVVFAHTCQFTFIPSLLSFVALPSVYYLHEAFGAGATVAGARVPGSSDTIRARVDPWDPLLRGYRWKLDRIQRRSLGRTTRVLANSFFTRARMQAGYGVSAPVCPIGVDTEAFRPLGVPKSNHVLSVGELSPRKGFDFVIKALAMIPEGRRPRLRIASNTAGGDERVYLEQLARESGVGLTILTSPTHEVLVREYNEAALCVCAQVNEPFGLVALEAMACGTAVAAVREGGLAESVVHGETGVLVDRDVGLMAQAIGALLRDPGKLQTLGAGGRAHVEAGWTWDRSVNELEVQLTQVAALRPVGATVTEGAQEA